MKRILVVDDEIFLRKILEFQLKRAGYEVVCAENAFDADEMIEDGQVYDLIITDIMMPVKSGWDLVSSIRMKHKLTNQKIIMLSARELAVDIEDSKKYNIDAFFMKPYQMSEILAKVAELLDA